jgi:hypothetical protein
MPHCAEPDEPGGSNERENNVVKGQFVHIWLPERPTERAKRSLPSRLSG